MVNPERTPLTGEVDVDQCQVGAREIGRRDAQWYCDRRHRPGPRPRASRDRFFQVRLRGTHRSVSNEHPQVYVEEFTFRYNRRSTPMALFPQVVIGASGGGGWRDPGKLVADDLELVITCTELQPAQF